VSDWILCSTQSIIAYNILLYVFFWVVPRRLNFICRRFGTLCLHLHRQVGVYPTCLWTWNRQSVPKRRYIKFRPWGITQKKTYNIQYTAKVWNQEYNILFYPTGSDRSKNVEGASGDIMILPSFMKIRRLVW